MNDSTRLEHRCLGSHLVFANHHCLYGVVLLMAGIAYLLLRQAIIRSQGPDSILKKAIGRDWKGKLSSVTNIVAIAAAILGSPKIAQAIFVIAR
jgi:hypothetical protein